MDRSPLEIVEIAGDAVEVAFRMGRLRAAKIASRVEYWNRFLARRFRGNRDGQASLERGFLAAARKAPRYLEEVRAIAEGSGVPFADVFRLNLTELRVYTDKCTTLVLPYARKGGRAGVLLAHNEDWDPRRNDVFVLKARLPGVRYAVLAYDGYLPGLSSGVNSFGLAHAINYLAPPDRRVGLPRIFITRHLVTARDFGDVLRWANKNRRAFGQGIHLAQKGEYCGLELTSRRVALWRPLLPAVHSNHYLDQDLARIGPRPGRSSLKRYQAASRLLALAEGRREGRAWSLAAAREAARKILSDRSGLPYAVWRNADVPEDRGATVATNLVDEASQTLEIYRRRPSGGEALKIAL